MPTPPRQAKKRPAKECWQDPELLTTPLLTLFLDAFGTTALAWLPDTVRREVRDEFGAALPPASLDRIMAGCHLLTSDDFWQDPTTFNELCLIFSGHLAQPDVWVPADAAECAWGLTEAYLLDPPDDSEPVSDEIRLFLGHVLDEEGVVDPPDVLRLAVRDRDSHDAVKDWADDPDVYSGIWQSQKEKSDAIVAWVRERLELFMKQMHALPLRHGNTSRLFARH
jgi:hypothetical protein